MARIVNLRSGANTRGQRHGFGAYLGVNLAIFAVAGVVGSVIANILSYPFRIGIDDGPEPFNDIAGSTYVTILFLLIVGTPIATAYLILVGRWTASRGRSRFPVVLGALVAGAAWFALLKVPNGIELVRPWRDLPFLIPWLVFGVLVRTYSARRCHTVVAKFGTRRNHGRPDSPASPALRMSISTAQRPLTGPWTRVISAWK